jgi:hypothetical protein
MPSLVKTRSAAADLEPRRSRRDLAVVLPGERHADTRLVERAVAELNRLYTHQGLQTASLVGEYLLSTFFNGDPAEFHRQGGRHVSFRALARREDLQLSASFLWSCVAVVEQLRLLPEELARALPLSHHKLLLTVRDPREKLGLARRAAQGAMSRRDLELEVRRRQLAASPAGAGKRRPGRPPHPPLVRALSQVERALDAVLGEEWVAAAGRGVPVDRAEVLLDEIEQRLERLARALKSVRDRVAPRR